MQRHRPGSHACGHQAGDEDIFLAFAKENRKNITQVERAYYGVISDALEGCFSFKVDPADYAVEIEMAESTSYSDALDKAVRMERKIIEFYSDAAEQAKLLLADVPRVFTLIARRRNDRIDPVAEFARIQKIPGRSQC